MLLFLKVPKVERKKDLSPVASIISIPKSMLRILFNQLKSQNKNLFYGFNDYSAPGRGADLAVYNLYEILERNYYNHAGDSVGFGI